MSIISKDLLHPFNTTEVIHNKENNESFIFEDNAFDNHKQPQQIQFNDIKLENNKDIDDSNRITSKRGPSTPLTPSLQQQNIVRRRIITQSPIKSNSRSNTDNHSNAVKYQLIDSKLENWQLHKALTKTKETIKFLQLEQEFSE
ncbi:hypothetical protein DFJ63DRAFT_159520 [Scheffersomyces coipomensis]|uniref:uncharacterized protein n=1 Tax=Scheffersomyces coipomensis TaxID=1788519 RepID=UPI00315CDEA2